MEMLGGEVLGDGVLGVLGAGCCAGCWVLCVLGDGGAGCWVVGCAGCRVVAGGCEVLDAACWVCWVGKVFWWGVWLCVWGLMACWWAGWLPG